VVFTVLHCRHNLKVEMLDVTSSKHDPHFKHYIRTRILSGKELQFCGSSHQNCIIFALTDPQLVLVDSTYLHLSP